MKKINVAEGEEEDGGCSPEGMTCLIENVSKSSLEKGDDSRSWFYHNNVILFTGHVQGKSAQNNIVTHKAEWSLPGILGCSPTPRSPEPSKSPAGSHQRSI